LNQSQGHPVTYSSASMSASAVLQAAPMYGAPTYDASGAVVTHAAPVMTYAAAPSPVTYTTAPVVVVPTTQRRKAAFGGGNEWMYDKTAFKNFVKVASSQPHSQERKELYGFLAECFLDADGDRDGWIGHAEFDFLIERAAAMPRRFGLAPSWEEMYGDVAHRQESRNSMFAQMDKLQTGKIGLESWIEFCMAHVAEKAAIVNMGTLDFMHLEKSGPDGFVKFLATAMQDRHSEEYKSLYEFLFKTFIDVDSDQKGTINVQQFDALIEVAAAAPRAVGLAPPSDQTYVSEAHRIQARQEMFDAMDDDKSGTITFAEYLNWVLNHVTGKVQDAQGIEPTKAAFGGGLAWQYDKTAFKNFVKTATSRPQSKDRKELYGFLAECFLDADGDRDGWIGHDEFDFLIERAATLPRRFGLAPSWVEMYGDVAHRQQSRNSMFAQMDKHQHGKIGLAAWIEFCMAHIKEKAATVSMVGLDFMHLEKSGPDQFIKFLASAISNRHSEEYKSFYNFLFQTFIDVDADQKGTITVAQFDALIEVAAAAPRTVGLAPPTSQTYRDEAHRRQARQEMFNTMDDDKSGTITFDEYLNWVINHVTGKVQEALAR